MLSQFKKYIISEFKNYFIPSGPNDYRPYFLRKRAFFFTLVFILLLEFIFLLQTFLILPKTSLLAVVMPQAVIDFTNEKRKASGLSILKHDPKLELAAQSKAEDMAKSGYFSHTSPEGKTPWYWFYQNEYNYLYAGENLAIHFFDSKDLVQAWLNSPSHRANILNKNYNDIGIGIAKGAYEGKETVFIVQMFGTSKGGRISAAKNLSASNLSQTQSKEAIPEQKTAGEFSAGQDFNQQEVSEQTLENKNPASETGFLTKTIIASPRNGLGDIYFAVIILVATALILNIFIHIRIQHPLLIFNGIFLLVFVSLIFWLNQYLTLSQAKIF